MSPLLIVPEFITADNCRRLRGLYNRLLTTGLKPRGTTATDCRLSDVDEKAAKTLADEVAARLMSHFGLCPLSLDYAAFTRLTVGGGHELHADAVKLDGTPNHTPNRVASAMLYLTEWGKEFTGGLIHFPGLEQVVPPRAGMLVGFLTTLDYRHEVPTVTSGTRDALAFWFHKDCSCGCK